MSDGENKEDEEMSAATGKTFYASDICICGPNYTIKEASRNNILKVPRVITDFPSLILFAIFIALVGVIWAFAMVHGQYYYLMNGMDWRGKVCGQGPLAEYPKQTWTNPLIENIRTGAICVKDCPTPALESKDIDKNTLICVCNDKYWPQKFKATVDPSHYSQALLDGCSNYQAQQLGYFMKVVTDGDTLLEDTKVAGSKSGGPDQPCAFLYRTHWSMHKCVPGVEQQYLEQIVQQEQGNATKFKTDYVKAWLAESDSIYATLVIDVASSLPVIAALQIVAIFLSVFCLVLLRYWPWCVCRGSVFVMMAMLIAQCIITWRQHEYYHGKSHKSSTHLQDEQSTDIYFGLFILSVIWAAFHFFFSAYMWNALGAAESILEIVFKTFTQAPVILIYPLVHMGSFAAVIIFWLMGGIMMFCAGTIETEANGVANMEHFPGLRRLAPVYLFGIIWLSGFMNAIGYMIVSSTLYLSSFAQPKNMMYPDPVKGVAYSGERFVPHSIMTVSTCIIVRYHMGSAALGSFFLAIIWPFRAFFSAFGWIKYKHEGAAQWICCFCGLSQKIFKNYVQQINKMAYLQTVLHGFNFLGAAFDGLKCVLSGLEYISDTTLISSFILVLIKFCVSFAVSMLLHVLVESGAFGVSPGDLTYSWVPYLMCICISYTLCTAFMLIIEVAIDAVMVAFCEAKFVRPWGAIRDHQLSTSLKKHMEDWSHWDGECDRLNTPTVNYP